MENAMWSILADFFYGLLIFALGALAEYARDKKKTNQAIENGLCALLRNEILKEHNNIMEKGYVTSHQYECVTKMNDAYKALGGNGLIKKMMKEINDVKTRTISRNE